MRVEAVALKRPTKRCHGDLCSYHGSNSAMICNHQLSRTTPPGASPAATQRLISEFETRKVERLESGAEHELLVAAGAQHTRQTP